ncbi:MAG: helix-turn-helix domain-containing protein [Myxococcales bacterium]|nr:helix-turn-helix domain-containing protein [Myxococcales bacterium]
MIRVALLVVNGFTDSGLSVLLDVLRTANVLSPGAFHIDVASASGPSVRAASGLALSGVRSLRVAASADVVIVPGIWIERAEALDNVLARADVHAVCRAVWRAERRGALVAGACAGVFLLAESGVLANRRVTTTWWLAPELARRHPRVRVETGEALLVHGRVLTAGAVFAVADLALSLVGRFLGPTQAHRCSSLLLLDRHPSQAPYMALHQLTSQDPLVRRAEQWVRAHLGKPFAMAALAKAVGTSTRTLARKLERAVGLAPVAFVQRIRVETAVHLLRTTRKTTAEISEAVGYTDESTLRRLLRRDAHASARELRSRAARAS